MQRVLTRALGLGLALTLMPVAGAHAESGRVFTEGSYDVAEIREWSKEGDTEQPSYACHDAAPAGEPQFIVTSGGANCDKQRYARGGDKTVRAGIVYWGAGPRVYATMAAANGIRFHVPERTKSITVTAQFEVSSFLKLKSSPGNRITVGTGMRLGFEGEDCSVPWSCLRSDPEDPASQWNARLVDDGNGVNQDFKWIYGSNGGPGSPVTLTATASVRPCTAEPCARYLPAGWMKIRAWSEALNHHASGTDPALEAWSVVDAKMHQVEVKLT